MTTKENYGKAIVSVDILDINTVEMRQMCELEQRIAEVLFSHINKVDANGNAIKPQYLNYVHQFIMGSQLSVLNWQSKHFIKSHQVT